MASTDEPRPAQSAAAGMASGGEEYFREIADASPTILWVTDATGYCTYLNAQWHRFTGQKPEEGLGLGWTTAVHPDDRERAARMFHDALARQGRFEVDYRLRRHDGEYRDAVDSALPRFGKQGEFLGHVGAVLDIGDRKELERRLLHAQKLEAVGRLAGGVAHDFNNLLTMIAGHAELISQELAPGDELREDLNVIAQAVQRASALTRQLLAFSRQQVLRPELIDLNAAVRTVERMFAPLIGEDIVLYVDLAERLPLVRVDRAQIDQVIINLVINARDAMPRGGSLTITTEALGPDRRAAARGEEAWVALTVSDTGVGITDEDKRRLFEPFFTTKPEGTGLGLATVYGIMQQSGGEVVVTSEVGKGTSFTAILPLADDQSALEPATEQADVPGGTGTILIVEDDPSVRELVARVLARQGYRVITAANASEALQRLDENDDVALLITDVVMPGQSGPELAEIVARRRGRRTQVILMSGYAGDEMTRRGISSGEYAFLPKPFTTAELARAVRDALARTPGG